MSEHHDEEVQRVIRLKRFEQPPQGYFEEFLDEFQRRQRSELLQRSSRSLFFERLSTYFDGRSTLLLGAGAGVAYACLMAYMMLSPSRGGVETASASESTHPAAPVNLWQVNNMEIVPASHAGNLVPVTETVSLLAEPMLPASRGAGTMFLDEF